MAKDQITTVDIGTNSVKVLQLSLTRSGLTIINSGVRSYPRGSASERITDDVIIDTLSHLLHERVIKTNPVAMAIPRQFVTVKSLTGLPTSATDEEIDKMVPIQVDSELPFAIADAIYSAYNLQRLPEGTSLEVVAAKKTDVERYINIAEQIGLKLTSIVPSAFATYGVIFDRFKEQLAGRTVAVADIGARMTDFCIIQHGRLIFSRSFTFGGNSLTEQFEKEYKLSFPEAEERKLSEVESQLDEEDTLACQWVDSLAVRIGQSLQPFRAESGSNGIGATNGVDSLWLCGGSSQAPGLDDCLSRKLDIGVNVWNPLEGVEGQTPEMETQSDLSVALGLGIIGVAGEERTPTVNANLLPEEIRQRAARTRRKIMVFAAAALAVIVIVGASLAFMAWRHSKTALFDDVSSKLELSEQKEDTRQAKTALENSILMQQVMTPYITPLEVLREMSGNLPDRKKIALNTLNIDKNGKVTMGVEANSHDDVSQMIITLSEMKLLDKVKLFDEVKYGAISKITKDKRPVLQVQIACLLNKDAIQEMK